MTNEDNIEVIMKCYTDLEQSKKLAEILPVESADMCYPLPCEEGDKPLLEEGGFGSIPCWSLAALLDVLKSKICYEKKFYYLNIEKDGTRWWIEYIERYGEANPIETNSTEELIDACYEMIIKLHEQNIL